MKIHFNALICLLAMGQWDFAYGQQKACDLIPNFSKHEAELHRKYLQNIQVKVTEKGYDKLERTGKLEGTAERITIFGDGNTRMTSIVKHVGESNEVTVGTLYNSDELYSLVKSKTGYEIAEHKYDANNMVYVDETILKSGALLPFCFNGWLRLRAGDALNDYMTNHGKGPVTTFQSVEETTYKNRPALMMTLKMQTGSLSKNYYDPSNNYAWLGFEMDSVLSLSSKKTTSTKVVADLTYEPSDLGYPVPKKYSMNFVEPNGKLIPMLEIDFIEWKRYTPTADDFDLEKQFGVKPLPRPPGVGPSPIGKVGASRSGWGLWLWISAAVLASITAVIAFLIWRKKRKAKE